MTRIKKFFPIFLSFFVVFSVLILVVSLVSFRDLNKKELEAVINNGQFNPEEKIAYFNGKKIIPPNKPWIQPLKIAESDKVLSAEFNDNKWIEIDLTQQKLRSWEGGSLIDEFTVSTGKRQWGTATPVGVYRIWIKLKSALMHGGSGSTYYYLPNVQCTQYFYKGYGIHGTYWHNNFGHPMSHGCINMRNEDACKLFYWTSPPLNVKQTFARPSQDYPGTKVVIHGETPWQ